MTTSRFLLALGTCTSLFSASASAQAPVVISQIYTASNTTGSVFNRDFVELRNRTASPINLAGWSLQYASATGTVWFQTNLTGTIPANGYYLIQTTNTGTIGGPLPTPDDVATWTVNPAAASGKFALVNTTNQILDTGCPLTGAFDVVDFVGYGNPGGSNPCFEGTGTTGTPLNATTAAFRNSEGCTDTNNNAADFTTGLPAPRTSSSPAGTPCVINQADLSLAASGGPAQAYIGTDGVTFNLTVANIGGGEANNCLLVLPLPGGLGSFSSVPAGAVSGSNYEIALGTINAGGSVPIVIFATPVSEQPVTASFSVSTTSSEVTGTNNGASVSLMTLLPASQIPLKISQVYPGGGPNNDPAARFDRDYVEIFNAGNAPISLNGRSIQFQGTGGSTWTRINFANVTVPPGGYYSIALGSAGANGAPLPPTDQNNTVFSISASGGKWAIANANTNFQFPCPIVAPQLIDLVGYGFADCVEGVISANWVDGDAVSSLVRLGSGCTDTNYNNADFTTSLTLSPRTASSPLNPCGPAGCNRADITDIGDSGAGPDGQLTVDDLIAFVNTFGDAIGCPGTAPCNRADITDIGDTGAGPDGELTVDDIIAFVNAFGDGCPA